MISRTRNPGAFLLYFAPSLLFAQPYAISTYTGGAPPITPAAATSVSIGLPGGLAVDPAGNVFFSGRNCIFRIDSNGVLTRIAGNSRPGYSGDGGLAVNAQFTSPNSVALDNSGNIYFTGDNRVRMISAAGIITTVAGNGTAGFSGDGGPALAAQLGSPDAIAVDGAGNIYLADYFNGIRKISAAGMISTIAGTGTVGFSGDGGPAVSAQLSGPEALAADRAGNLYIADSSNYRIRKISPQGIITTFAGNGTLGYSGDGGPAAGAQIDRPDAIAFDTNGNLYIAASYNFRVRKVSPAGIISTVYAGDAQPGTEGEAIGFGADSTGNVYLSDSSRYRIRKVSPDGSVSTAAGNGTFSFSGDGGPAFQAQLFGPQAVVLDAAGNLLIADRYNSRIRKVSPAGIITTIAGDGTYGYSGDGGPAINAHFFNPWALALDHAGNLYVADGNINRIRRISPDGIITTVAGGDTAGYSGDGGPAINAQLNAPTALAVDSAGNLYIADAINRSIRKVSVDGIITTVPISAPLTDPSGVAVDSAGNLYIADGTGFGRISKVTPQGVLTTLAVAPDIGGPPRTRQTAFPNAVATDTAGNVYFTDAYNYRVRKISPDGTIATIAGNETFGYSGDNGPATRAQLFNPAGLAVDAAGRIFIADSFENAIRLLQPIPPVVTVTAVANGASNLPGPVAAGEIVVLYGSMLGPPDLTSASVTGAAVTFNGLPARILYASFTQVAAIVPGNLTGTTAQVVLAYQGQTSAPLSVPLVASAPALFTLDSTGLGQAAAINQDGSINSAVYPAPAGSVVSLYATGGGILPLPVTVTLSGRIVTPDLAGSLNPSVEGLMQIQIRIPSDLPPGSAVPVVVSTGGVASQSGVTLVTGPR